MRYCRRKNPRQFGRRSHYRLRRNADYLERAYRRNSFKIWRPKEIAALRLYYPDTTLTLKEIQRQFFPNRSIRSMRSKASALKLRRKHKYPPLSETHPHLIVEWDEDKNGPLTPDITQVSGKKYWWTCSAGHSYQARADNRAKKGTGCRQCYLDQRNAYYDQPKICRECGRDETEVSFLTHTLCRTCAKYLERHRQKGRKCEICKKTDAEALFEKPTICVPCEMKLLYRSVLGRRCTSCGLSDEDKVKAGKIFGHYNDKCASCLHRGLSWGWCPQKIHSLPPPRERVYKSKGRGRLARDYPSCNCTTTTVDPNIRLIPLEDEADPSRDYIPLKERLRLVEERFDMGESEEKSRVRGHGPYKGDAPFDPTGRKGSSKKSPRRSTRGGSPFDIGPKRPGNLRRYRRNAGGKESRRRRARECPECGTQRGFFKSETHPKGWYGYHGYCISCHGRQFMMGTCPKCLPKKQPSNLRRRNPSQGERRRQLERQAAGNFRRHQGRITPCSRKIAGSSAAARGRHHPGGFSG